MDLETFLAQESGERPSDLRSGTVAIIGRPNVGKSTLMNAFLGEKLAITTPKPQTTRHRILGIHSTETAQIVFVDTPGIHKPGKRAMNRYLNRAATSVIEDVDMVVWVVEARAFRDEDEAVAQRLADAQVPLLIAVNKVDQVADKTALLPYLQALQAQLDEKGLTPLEIVPLSARKGVNLDALERAITERLPNQGAIYPIDQVTDRGGKFRAAEIIREKLIMALEQELPYALTVEIEQLEDDPDPEEDRLLISAVIYVERAGQKGIVIGKGGALLKKIGERSRKDLNKVFDRRVHLQLWVKVKEDWSDNDRSLRSLGYE